MGESITFYKRLNKVDILQSYYQVYQQQQLILLGQAVMRKKNK